jgi:hypothetical protein
MGRKKLELDEEKIWEAATKGATYEAIARALGKDADGKPVVSSDTIRRRYAELISQAKANGDIELYAALWEEGVIGVPDQNGNRKRNGAVLLRLAEHRLGMSQKMHQTNERQEFNIVIGPKPNTIPLEADDTSNNTIAGTDGLLEQ